MLISVSRQRPCSQLVIVWRPISTSIVMNFSFSLIPGSSSLLPPGSGGSSCWTKPPSSNSFTCRVMVEWSCTTLCLVLSSSGARKTWKLPKENSSTLSTTHPSSALGRHRLLGSFWPPFDFPFCAFFSVAAGSDFYERAQRMKSSVYIQEGSRLTLEAEGCLLWTDFLPDLEPATPAVTNFLFPSTFGTNSSSPLFVYVSLLMDNATSTPRVRSLVSPLKSLTLYSAHIGVTQEESGLALAV